MKKLMLIAAACVALASCVKNEVEPFVNESPISFQAVQGLQHTRADEAVYAKEVPFAASAFLLDGTENWAANGNTEAVEPYFLLQTVTWNTNVANEWTTAAPYYWPIQDKLVFFAHSPATFATAPTIAIAADTKAYSFTGYDVDANKNTDFMVANVTEAINYANTANKVPVRFNHKLTKISFKVQTDGYPTNKTIAVNKIVLTGLANKGDLVLDYNGAATTAIGWTNQAKPSPAVEYVYFDGSQAISGETVIPRTPADDPATLGVDEGAQNIFLPQDFVGNADAKVIVDYTITTQWGPNPTDVATEQVKGIEVLLKDGTPTAWQMNKHITYVLSVTPGKRILWEQPTIEDWTKETGSLAI